VRLLDHAEARWLQLTRVKVTYRGAFGYVTGVLPDGQNIPLCRLRYGGSAHSFGLAIYSRPTAATNTTATKTPSCSPDSLPEPRKKPSTPPARSTSPGSPRTTLLTQLSTNLRSRPLSGSSASS
jgi:hypothetical protein